MSDADPTTRKWWHKLLWALAFFGGAAYLYWDLTQWEQQPEGSRRMPSIGAMLYTALGKWGIVGLLALIGAGFAVLSVIQLIREADE
jgi:hypothetical protein